MVPVRPDCLDLGRHRVVREVAGDHRPQPSTLVGQAVVASSPGTDVPAPLLGNAEATAINHNLDSLAATTFKCPTTEEDRAALALKIDLVVRERAPAGWKGDETRERTVQNAIYPLLDRDREATQALFEIIKNRPGY